MEGGGLTPPPGFLEQADADCRAASEAALADAAPTTRQLNGQTLLSYALEDGRTAQCSVRHADGAVLVMRVMGEAGPDVPADWRAWTGACEKWDNWNKPAPPFRIHGGSYHVGTCGISAILVTGDDGHVLIDAGTQVGARHVAENVAALGFEMAEVRLLLSSHEHHDHVGGLAELQRRTGARVVASAPAAPVLESGALAASDPQFGMHDAFESVPVDRIVADGEEVRLGDLAFTAVATPGHTDGALSWRWESCEGTACETIVYADSLSPVSRDDYRFSDHPDRLDAYRAGLDRLEDAGCTLLLTPHPSASGMRDRLERGKLTTAEPCLQYANGIRARLDRRLAQERAE